MATRAPSSCSRFAAASPMPLLPPVTTATFPSSLFMMFSVLYLNLTESCSPAVAPLRRRAAFGQIQIENRSEEHTSELQSHLNLVCRLLLEKKKTYSCLCVLL